jgi:hypothetical protein
MNLQQIKQAVDAGKIVCWLNDRYMVKVGGKYGYIIIHKPTNLEMEFLQFDGNKLIANESDFFILENP